MLICTFIVIGCPECEIITQQLQNQRSILVGVTLQRIQLADRIIKRSLGHTTRLLLVVQYLIVEHGEVQRQAQTHAVCAR